MWGTDLHNPLKKDQNMRTKEMNRNRTQLFHGMETRRRGDIIPNHLDENKWKAYCETHPRGKGAMCSKVTSEQQMYYKERLNDRAIILYIVRGEATWYPSDVVTPEGSRWLRESYDIVNIDTERRMGRGAGGKENERIQAVIYKIDFIHQKDVNCHVLKKQFVR